MHATCPFTHLSDEWLWEVEGYKKYGNPTILFKSMHAHPLIEAEDHFHSLRNTIFRTTTTDAQSPIALSFLYLAFYI